MLSHQTPPENATHAMLRDARRDGLLGLVSNGQAVNVTHYFYRWRRRRLKFHSLRWSLGLVGNCCIQPLPFANKKISRDICVQPPFFSSTSKNLNKKLDLHIGFAHFVRSKVYLWSCNLVTGCVRLKISKAKREDLTVFL